MDYNLGFITSVGEDLNDCINLLEEAKEIVSKGNENLYGNWEGQSNSKYLNLTELLIGRYDEKIDELNGVIGLLSLVDKHNRLREERERLKERIAYLRSIAYKEVTDDDGNTRTEVNEAALQEIAELENKIKEINNQMDMLISNIRGITGG